MGLCIGKSTSDGTSSSSPPYWPDLPPEILGLVLAHLASHNDRLSFAAVCRDWRLGAEHQRLLLPPAVPCINLGGGAYQSLVDGKVRLFATPSNSLVHASYGSLLLYQHRPSRRCFLRDPFSGAGATPTPAIEVPCRYKRRANRPYDVTATCNPIPGNPCPVLKIVVQSPQLVVAMFLGGPLNVAPAANFACFLPGRPQALWWSRAAGTSAGQYHGLDFVYMDVTIHHGKIFAIGWNGDLFVHEFPIGDGEAALSESRVEHVIKGQHSAARGKYHLMTSSDNQKLLMVRWRIPDVMTDHHTMSVHVFEADLDKGQWSVVKDLSDQVLFVGTTGSRALAAGGSSEQYHPSFQGGNRVFILGSDWAWARTIRRAAPCRCSDCRKLVDGISSYCVYDMKNGKTSLVSIGKGHIPTKSSRLEWFFPST